MLQVVTWYAFGLPAFLLSFTNNPLHNNTHTKSKEGIKLKFKGPINHFCAMLELLHIHDRLVFISYKRKPQHST